MNTSHCFRSAKAVELYADTQKVWDKPMYESKSFVAVPSVGAIVEGWLLVVPRNPALSFATLPETIHLELETFLDEVVGALEESYGPVWLFEHGPSFQNGQVGCGVDYAHLHVVPINFDLMAEVKQIKTHIQWERIASFKELSRRVNPGQNYWFAQAGPRATAAYLGFSTDKCALSQLFRRAIANAVGRPQEYDWKLNLGGDNLTATVRRLSASCIDI